MAITYVPHEDPIQKWPPFLDPLLPVLPASRDELLHMLGNPASLNDPEAPSKEWVKRNIVERRDMPGIPHKWYFQCHRLAEARFREGLRRAQVVCPEYVITRAASFNFRHMQHNPKLPLSDHSWGAAIDINPEQNKAVRFKKRSDVPEFFSKEWLKIWPAGFPRAFVDAMLSVGLTWGGDWDRDWDHKDQSFIDPMHWQLRLQ